MKVLIDFEVHKFNLKNICTVPLYEKVKNIILIDSIYEKDVFWGKTSIVKLRLNTFDSSFNNFNGIQNKNITFLEKISFLYSGYGRKIILELNVSPEEIDEIDKVFFTGVCSVENNIQLESKVNLIKFYKGVYSQNCDVVKLLKELIENSSFLQWQDLNIIKEYILLGTGEIIKKIMKNEKVYFNKEKITFFANEIYIENTVNKVNEYLKAFYSFLEHPEDDNRIKELEEKYEILKQEIKDDYSKVFVSEANNPSTINVINSFIREGVYLGIKLKNMLNNHRVNAELSSTYRSQLSYISKFKRMVSSDFIKSTISQISDENVKRQMGDLFSKYNEAKFFFDSYKDEIISFTDIEDFTFYFQRLSVINLNLSEIIITLTTEEFKKIFNNFEPVWFQKLNQPRYNLWCIPYSNQYNYQTKPEIVLMIDKMCGIPF